MAALDGHEPLPEDWLKNVRNDDNIFPLVQPLDWAKLPQP
jgi:1,4-alpha-glucan branching enzyme